jgi:hypothetical protein
MELLELPIQAAGAAAQEILLAAAVMVALAAPALSFCPTPCQKAMCLLLPLLEHLEAQQHPLPLITWW